MLRYEAQLLLGAVSYIASTISDWRLYAQIINERIAKPLIISLEQKAHFVKSVERLRDSAIQLEMVASAVAGRDAFEFYAHELASPRQLGAFELTRLLSPAERLIHSYTSEIGARRIYSIEQKSAKFYADAESLFGTEVTTAFPTVRSDVSEAGKCRALGLWTACVMHLMRTLEVGLQGLARHYGVIHAENWNMTLNELEAKLRAIKKKIDGADAERWAAEAGTHLRFLKNAHRNHAMHPLKIYDEEYAVEIFDGTRSFMRHLASRLAE
jgi:hypothetical protein